LRWALVAEIGVLARVEWLRVKIVSHFWNGQDGCNIDGLLELEDVKLKEEVPGMAALPEKQKWKFRERLLLFIAAD
jgi:hypothetical protein